MKLRAPEETVCDPVWPNVGVQDWYYNRLASQLRLMQADVLYSLTTAWKLPNPVGLAQDGRNDQERDNHGRWTAHSISAVLDDHVDRETGDPSKGPADPRERLMWGLQKVIDATGDDRIKTPHRREAARLLRQMQADPGFNPEAEGMAQDALGLVSVLTALLDAWAYKWTKRWDNMSDRIARDFATRNMRATDAGVRASFKRAGFTVEFKATRVMQLAYSTRVAANVGLIKSIPQEYLKDVSTQVWNAVTTGGDMHALEQNIQKVYGVANRRAALIARDQNNKAKASFEETRRMELGIETAEWQHSGAGQERYKRPTHVAAGRKHTRYQVKDGWLDPATNTRIWPGTEINCRCTSRSVIPGLSRRR